MDCLDDTGYAAGELLRTGAVATGALIRQVAAVAIAIDNAAQLVANYKRQRDIAKRSVQITQEQQSQLRNVFWPREEQFLAEFSNPEAIEEVEVLGRRYGGRLVSTVSAAFAMALKDAKCAMPRYCTSANSKVLQDLMMARSTAVASARILGRQIAFAEYQARTDENYNRRLQAVSLGRGLINEAMSLYQAAGQGLAAVGSNLLGNLNSAIVNFGQARTRVPTGANERDFSSRAFAAGGRNMADVGDQAQSYLQTTNKFGFEASQESFGTPDVAPYSGDASGLSDRNQFSTNKNLQAEVNNRGAVGNDNLAPQGFYTFPVAGITGGSVTVDLGMFRLGYVDDKEPGDLNSPLF